MKILDAGCGTGILSDFFRCDITGLDNSEDMLSKNFHKCVKGSVEDIPFEDNTFDMVVCRSLLHHLKQPGLALSEMKRVLKQGGLFHSWETNSNSLSDSIRNFFQPKDRFSAYHAKLRGIPNLISKYFKVSYVKYGGLFGYTLVGFPDILEFPEFITHHWNHLMRLDEAIPQSIMKHIGFYVTVKGTK
ncbi:class I SAM-dependent methyltransferase [Patescibacteria group bacterium]|nr:class I SAM-dependent methyltransferase [Patescibacteria group bacterium]